ncbi:MAG: Uma2 family endonuclease [Saprospiraceae bacterium]
MEVIDKKYTVENFFELELPDDATHYYELLNGLLVRRNAPSGEHQHVQSELLERFFAFVASKKLGKIYSSPTAVVLSDNDVPQPDIIFLKKENLAKFDPTWGIKGAPDLIVEIISPSSYRNDRVVKKELYQKYGVKEYWLVDSNYKSIEIFLLKENTYQLHAFGIEDEKITSIVLEGFELELKDIFLK